MYKRALISVSDKTGLYEFLKPLVEKGLQLVSTGGTAQYLRDNKLPVMDVSEVTQFPEVMDGRVKTLHPKIHMGLLARAANPSDIDTLKRFETEMFDLVVVNLYPFEESLKKSLSEPEMIEKIDIGGPSMLRSAAKSFQRITVVCDPQDYQRVHESSDRMALNKQLAAKVFQHCSYYDSLISQYLNPESKDTFLISGKLEKELRYGENPHQKAQWYRSGNTLSGFQDFQILQGKELSYNNLLDLDAALTLSLEIPELNAVAVKHNNPCGVAYGNSGSEVIQRLVKTDPVSIFGGIVASNATVDGAMAEELNKIFLECVVAPDYTNEALIVFSKKKNLRLLKYSKTAKKNPFIVKSIMGGFLVQDQDTFPSPSEQWRVFGKPIPQSLIADFVFGEKVCGYLKSNSIALIDNKMTIGLGMGQVNRVDAVEQSLGRALKHHQITPETILVSDAFFPFVDSIELVAKHKIKWVFQPGGSVKDDEVIKRCQELDVNLIFSGKRHFRH
ncbi:MAG: bifunctional phosphoribosylaminoimidazolecarboxamide formyltransferase/IMP cyclohydrolase [Bdellovibrionaceae bacterium]|nr:bifunctional phosphoribosylaminoimidazolecarboxamide formyltransferase/IMP cyclohydrolase [Pseudobdellovibrionaceae bacterium]